MDSGMFWAAFPKISFLFQGLYCISVNCMDNAEAQFTTALRVRFYSQIFSWKLGDGNMNLEGKPSLIPLLINDFPWIAGGFLTLKYQHVIFLARIF